MKIAFATTQSLVQSTLIGRIIPIAKELAKNNEVTVLVHEEVVSSPHPSPLPIRGEGKLRIVPIGHNPFTRTEHGKKRKRGFALAWLLLKNAITAMRKLIALQPDVIIIVKPLPENTLAVALAKPFLKTKKILLDVDDFELFANVVSSLPERAVLHWSERKASKLAQHIITATPFLTDHMKALRQAQGKLSKSIPVTMIPTGYSYNGALSEKKSHTISYIGSISTSSGHLVMMLPEILQKVRVSILDVNMLIAGSGDDEIALKKAFQDLGLDSAVTWFGRFSDKDIPEIISKTAIIVDPIDASIVNRAKSSFRAMVAVSSGTPIVTSNIGIRGEIIPEQFHDQFFAASANSSEYAEKIIPLLQNPLSRQDSDILQQKSKEYTFERLASTYYTCCI
ncbi:MAG: glycosyltransferase [Candidatus Andersenbacteria bacterium]